MTKYFQACKNRAKSTSESRIPCKAAVQLLSIEKPRTLGIYMDRGEESQWAEGSQSTPRSAGTLTRAESKYIAFAKISKDPDALAKIR